MTDDIPQPPGHIKRYHHRNWLLTSSDWTQLADSPLDEDTKNEWKTYRQKLRDLDYMDDDCEFPLKPGQLPPEYMTPSPTPLPAGL